MSKVTALKGFKDLLPGASERWDWVSCVARQTFQAFGFSAICTPILERSVLFTRSIGEATDIVEKEMYSFQDWDKKSISLRPEGTASVVRAYLEHRLATPNIPTKLYYQGPMFRHERPQAGRLRQFHQIGAEIIGDLSPRQDIELLSLLTHFFQKLGFQNLRLEINSLGCPVCRPSYRKNLQAYLEARLPELCEDCKRRYTSNPLRILDCKREKCKETTQDAPASAEQLCQECDDHFYKVKAGLKALKIDYTLNLRLVRGLDYYTKTAFEMTTRDLGAQNAVAAGGRYDGLVEALGGPETPAIGFAIGMERLMQLIPACKTEILPLRLFFIPLGERAGQHLFPLLFHLRKENIRAEMGDFSTPLKRQMKQADRMKSAFVLIAGEREMEKDVGILRNMATKEQIEVPFSSLLEALTAQLSRRMDD